MKQRLSRALLFLLAVWLTGCGGGGTPAGSVSRATGRATVTVHWPARTRVIPLAANSISVSVAQGANILTTQLLARPANGNTASVTFNSLPVGTLNVTATAYPNADGTGTAQATAATPLAIQANQNTPFSLTMGSTIDHLDSAPVSLALAVGQVVPVTVTAKDAAGNTVLIQPQTLHWLSSDSTVASVDGTGNVTGVAIGGTVTPVQITVTETESNKSVNIPVVVSATGDLIAEEHFDYPDRIGFAIDGANGGTGWNRWWGTGFFGSLYVSSENLTYGTLLTSGNSVENAQTDDPTPGNLQLAITEVRPLASSLGQSGTVVYFSLLLRPLAPIGPGSSNYECGFSIGGEEGLFIGKTPKGNYYGMETGYLFSGQGFVASRVLAQQNTTVFLVVRVTFKDGKDLCELWVNPTPGQPLPATPDATKTDLDLGMVTNISLVSYLGAAFDELRIGSSYAAVAPTQ